MRSYKVAHHELYTIYENGQIYQFGVGYAEREQPTCPSNRIAEGVCSC